VTTRFGVHERLTGPCHQRCPADPRVLDPESQGISVMQSTLRSALRCEKSYIIEGAVCANGASLFDVAHLAHDRSNAACAQPRSAASYELGKCAEELAFGKRRLERKEVREDADDHQQFLCWIALHEREERRVERISYFDLVRILTQEEHTLIDELNDNEA
jgi:hypothetical protein